jgi:hypothetical protein
MGGGLLSVGLLVGLLDEGYGEGDGLRSGSFIVSVSSKSR